MSQLADEKSQSIIETSLTELAFIFFFILLVFSALKISEVVEERDDINEKKEVLEKDRKDLVETILPIQSALAGELSPTESLSINSIDKADLDEVFNGLARTKSEAVRIIQEHKAIETELSRSEASSSDIADSLKMLRQFPDVDTEGKSLKDIIAEVETKVMTLKGQNLNLRNKLEAEGNGLDHPPCWADPETGEIEFVYSITIEEDAISVSSGWPESRAKEVESKSFIREGIGKYKKPQSFWLSTRELYQESVKAECRHFVTVEDEAISKDAFKRYLLTIERHFYKLLL